MAKAAEAKAVVIVNDLKQVPEFTPSARMWITVFLLGILPPRAMRNVLSAHKVRGVTIYRGKMPEQERNQAPIRSETADNGQPRPTSGADLGS